MTPRQIALVQHSFALLDPYSEAFSQAVYGRLFQLDAGLKAIFPRDIARQGARLMQMLGVAVHGLVCRHELVPVLRSLGARHRGYGLRQYDFETLAQALNDSLRARLGEAFDAELQQAWHEALRFIAAEMLQGMLEADTEPQPIGHIDVLL
ncbi:globin domain-containing protein [Piscinibacter sp. XHJ-5]|uniref:globin domain-containing protein n=1 Tax=Piscinibacter sp. XHJ-5 TaxID=3037797 RepID=UPI0024535A3A|nr:globin domain-containing protein [Piscinibacter sp. XHJ-5]